MHLDEPNGVSVVVSNKGAVPLRADVVIEVFNDASATPTPIFSARTEDAFSGSRTFSTTWDGRVWDAGAQADLPLTGPLTVRGVVKPRDSGEDSDTFNDVKSAVRNLATHVVEASSSAPAATYEMAPGETWEAVVRVEQSSDVNGAATDDMVRLSLSGGTPGWAFTLEAELVFLPADDPVKQVKLFMRAPSAGAAGQTGTVSVVASPVDAPNSAQAAVAQSPPIRGTGRLEVTLPITSATAPVSESSDSTVSFPVHVDNLQNRDETLQLAFIAGSAPGPGLQPTATPATLATPSLGRASFEVEVGVPASSLAGTYTWTVRAVSTFTDVPPDDAPVPFVLSVSQWRAVQVAVDETTRDVEPGTSVAVEFEITNRGNGQDAFRLVPLQLPASWSLSGPTSVPIGPGATATATWALGVPGTSAAQVETLRFRVESTADAFARDTAVYSVRVLARTIPRVTAEFDLLPIEEGNAVTFELDVSNLGNMESDFSLGVAVREGTADTRPEPGFWVVERAPQNVRLASGASQVASVAIQAPSPLGPTDRIAVDVTLTSTSAPVRAGAILLRAFPAMPDLVLTVVGADPDPPYEGHPAALRFNVSNLGTRETGADVGVRVVFSEQGRTTSLATHELEAPALDWHPSARNATFMVPIPTDRGVAALQVTITADPEDLIEENEESNNEITHPVSLRRFDIRVDAPSDVTAEAGETIEFEGSTAFRVENLGPQGEDIEFGIATVPPWASATESFLPLEPGAPREVPFSFRIPEQPGIQDVVVKVRAQHPGRPALAVEEIVHVRLRDSTPPTISDVASNLGSVDRDQLVLFSAAVSDAMGVGLVKLFVISPAGTVESLPMTKNASGLYVLEKRFPVAGIYKWYVWAEDASLARNVRETSAQLQSLVVRPGGPARLLLVSPSNHSIVRPGTVILTSVVGGASLTSAEYSLNGEVFPLAAANPIQIVTRGWPDGLANVRVTARDAWDQVSAAEFNFTFDGTPPTVTGLGVLTRDPRPGESVNVTVLVSDQSEIRNVSLRLSFEDGTTREVPLRRDGPTFHGEFLYVAGIETLTVIAEDIAGNRGVGERSFAALTGKSLGAGLGGAAGGAPAPVVLAALAVSLLAFRRPPLGRNRA